MEIVHERFHLIDQLIIEIDLLRKKGKSVVFTNGCFDIIHMGHIKILREAKKLGDVLIVALNSDESVKKIKGNKRPLVGLEDRVGVLSSIRFVDFIISFDDETPIKLIEKISPDTLVKGSDHEKDKIVGRDWVESHGGNVVLVPFLKGRSSTLLIEKAKYPK